MKGRINLTVVTIMITILGSTSVRAGNESGLGGILHEIKVGLLHHDTNNLWSGSRREDGVNLNLEAVFRPYLNFLGGEVRPALGASINSTGDTSKLYLDARWETTIGNNFYFALGVGGAVHDGKRDPDRSDRKALGSRVLFHIPVEAGYRFDPHHGLSIYFAHISNASLASPNEGMDTLGIRYGYRF